MIIPMKTAAAWMSYLLIFYLTFYETSGTQAFSYASYYESNMVLQRAPARVSIWGYASLSDVGQKVQMLVTNGQQTWHYETTVYTDRSNHVLWKVFMDPVSDTHNPFTILTSLASYQAIQLTNVLFGDVWFCSGQSNMKLTISQVFNGSEEAAEAYKYSDIRIFSVGQVDEPQPQIDISSIEIHWSLPNATSILPFSAVCWLYAKYVYTHRSEKHVPLGLIESSWGGTNIEAWSSPDSLHACQLSAAELPQKRPFDYYAYEDIIATDLMGENLVSLADGSLWNAMVHPFLNLTIYGVLWYQGESNVNLNRDLYNCTFPAMITDWRQKWFIGTDGQTDLNFPFGFVQIGPNNGQPVIAGYADIRWHQTADVGYAPNDVLRNVFMAVSFDLTDKEGCVHYRDKATVSRRLALAGLTIAYGESVGKYEGPLVTDMMVDKVDKVLKLLYDHGQYALVIRNTLGFEICCQAAKMCQVDGSNWLSSSVVPEMSGDGIVALNTSACTDAVQLNGLRYGWRETPFPYLQAAVYSVANELPAPPFYVIRPLLTVKPAVIHLHKGRTHLSKERSWIKL